MKKIPILAITISMFLCVSKSYAQCTISDPPTLPDGTTATEQQMEAAQQSVKAYMTDTQEYLACLEMEGRAKTDKNWNVLYNAQSVKMESLAKEFNKQLRAFKARGN